MVTPGHGSPGLVADAEVAGLAQLVVRAGFDSLAIRQHLEGSNVAVDTLPKAATRPRSWGGGSAITCTERPIDCLGASVAVRRGGPRAEAIARALPARARAAQVQLLATGHGWATRAMRL